MMQSQPAPVVIHPTAVVDPGARLEAGVRVGPYAVIEAGAHLGEGCAVGAHAIIGRNTSLGRDNAIHHHAVIGTDSQDMKYRGEETGLVIGDGNVFREFVMVNRATGGGAVTRIGNGCRLLAYSHVAHNCVVGDGVVLANCTQLGGEVTIEEHAILGGLVGVHQFCRVGAYAIVGACSKVTQDILPFVMADGHPARPHGLNLVGLRRHGFPEATVAALEKAYHVLFLKRLSLEEALVVLTRQRAAGESTPEVARLVEFIRESKRRQRLARLGPDDSWIARPRHHRSEAE